MTIKALYPNVRPTLNLDFAKTKALDPRVTFTRASTATFVGSNGLIQTAASGAARFDHNPETGESLGLLVEEARTNNVLYSNGMNASVWWNYAYMISRTYNAGVSPDGTTTATLFTVNTNLQEHFLSGNTPSLPSAIYTHSIFAKQGTGSYNIQLRIGGVSEAPYIKFNFSTEQVTTNSSARVEKFPNGWYRLSVTSNVASTFSTAYIFMLNENNVGYYTGDGVSSFYVWGYQVEAGSSPTSYIPTTTTTVTRAADVATVSNTGSSIFPTSAFTTVNSPFGTAGGGTTVKLVGPTVKRTAVYAGDLPQAQINALAGVNDDFWRWRVLGSSFALPNFLTNGSVTVDWGDGVVETLTTAVHTFTNGGGYHDIGFRLNSGTFFRPKINNDATYKTRVIATGPAPASMKVDASAGFYGCSALKSFDATVDAIGGTDFSAAWHTCSGLTSFPLIDTAAVTSFYAAWYNCSSLTSFPLINTAAGTNFFLAWYQCSSLTSFPLINTAAGTSFQQAWQLCTGLTSFPLIDTGAATNFNGAWLNCSSLTSFPLINTSAVTNFQAAWGNCSSLTSFPLINTAAGTNFIQAWNGCTGLTSFPLINTAAGINFSDAWLNCSSLTSFPLINTAANTSFYRTWYGCSGLTSFPLINTAAATSFQEAWRLCSSLTSFPAINPVASTYFYRTWRNCSSLTDFPANFFDSWTGTPANNCFFEAWTGCSALTATSVENILNSIDTSGQSAPASGVNIAIDYNASSGTPSVATAITNLQSRGWTITLNGVLQ